MSAILVQSQKAEIFQIGKRNVQKIEWDSKNSKSIVFKTAEIIIIVKVNYNIG